MKSTYSHPTILNAVIRGGAPGKSLGANGRPGLGLYEWELRLQLTVNYSLRFIKSVLLNNSQLAF
jgi:hypothetical protein